MSAKFFAFWLLILGVAIALALIFSHGLERGRATAAQAPYMMER